MWEWAEYPVCQAWVWVWGKFIPKFIWTIANSQPPLPTSRSNDDASTTTLHGPKTTNVRRQLPSIPHLGNGYTNEQLGNGHGYGSDGVRTRHARLARTGIRMAG